MPKVYSEENADFVSDDKRTKMWDTEDGGLLIQLDSFSDSVARQLTREETTRLMSMFCAIG